MKYYPTHLLFFSEPHLTKINAKLVDIALDADMVALILDKTILFPEDTLPFRSRNYYFSYRR